MQWECSVQSNELVPADRAPEATRVQEVEEDDELRSSTSESHSSRTAAKVDDGKFFYKKIAGYVP